MCKVEDLTEILIPAVLADKIKERMSSLGFNSMNEYVEYVLRQVLDNASSDNIPTGEVDKANETKSEEAFSEEDEEKVKERLKVLGYLD